MFQDRPHIVIWPLIIGTTIGLLIGFISAPLLGDDFKRIGMTIALVVTIIIQLVWKRNQRPTLLCAYWFAFGSCLMLIIVWLIHSIIWMF